MLCKPETGTCERVGFVVESHCVIVGAGAHSEPVVLTGERGDSVAGQELLGVSKARVEFAHHIGVERQRAVEKCAQGEVVANLAG